MKIKKSVRQYFSRIGKRGGRKTARIRGRKWMVLIGKRGRKKQLSTAGLAMGKRLG